MIDTDRISAPPAGSTTENSVGTTRRGLRTGVRARAHSRICDPAGMLDDVLRLSYRARPSRGLDFETHACQSMFVIWVSGGQGRKA